MEVKNIPFVDFFRFISSEEKRSTAFILSASASQEEKQREIPGSIHYAKRIQRSLLPGERYIERIMNSRNKQ